MGAINMTDDEMEAESGRYGPDAFTVLPLSSGRIAVLGPRRELWGITDSFALACELAAMKRAPRQVIVTTKSVKVDLKRLGL